ncbi:Hypothetical protein IALB_2418 [Ignavibacterium album JCM 16511]|uniref:Uncharacterized protein n=1 Tax=Ignavibacterium album (strain DSM 19864 / JCM 16511 / NBRC 101810 / Mat9-16) TaxID=945713 RepID=I0AMB4_IGNAJ|nr:hypothetical protein [Ignavibacterium album]AFH50121.1 Hypothetical protein IALB_2418 [Ignavibacterium album JCM 16511]
MKPNTFIFYVLLFLMLFSFHSAYLIFSQVIIKEKVNINPKFNYNHKPEYGCSFGSCYYSLCDSSELFISFEPSSVQPGNNTIITLWLDENFTYQYNEDNYDLLQKNISSEPHCGTLTYIGEGQYLFSAPDTLTSDSVVITINYENYTHGCWGLKDGNLSKSKVSKFIEDCPDCFPYGTFLNHSYASAQLTIKWDSLYVEISPAEIYAGDTADVIIKKRLPDGSLADFDSSQTFEVATLEGCVMGNILVGDSLSNYFYDVHQPIKFVVADTVNADSALILLRVGLIEQKKTIRKKTFLETNCFTGYFQSQNYQNARAIIGPPLKIIYPTNNDIMWITEVPQMPVINCIARYNPLYLRTIEYDWKFVVWKRYERKTTRGAVICERISRSEFQGKSYSSTNGVTFWTVPFIVDSGYFYFKAVQNNQSIYYPQPYYGCNGEVNYWYDDNQEIFTGGEVFISLTAKDFQTGFVLTFLDSIPAGKIIGKNPTTDNIDNYANSNKIKAIRMIESKSYHFIDQGLDQSLWWPYNEVGWPVYGPPNGYGLMQIDNSPAATERQLWNWKANVDAGKAKLQEIYQNVYEYHGSPDDFKANWTNAFQAYNQGSNKSNRYYRWTGNKWELNKERKSNYGDIVYKKYLQLGGGD